MAGDRQEHRAQVSAYVIERNGRPVGAVEVEGAHREDALRALHEAGLEAHPAHREGEAIVYEVGGECTTEEPRPCELGAALVMAEALGTEAGVSVAEVRGVAERRHATEEEVRQAVRATVDRLPEGMRSQGQALLEEARL